MVLPKISIVIPTYNYGQFLEKAIKSVLDQNYPNFELIVLDGGSQDNTVEIIKKYERHIAQWRSKPDLCSNATVNEGFDMANGDLIGLLCADDWYEPGIFETVANAFQAEPELDIISFHVQYVKLDRTVDNIITEGMELDSLGAAAPNGRFYRKGFFRDYGRMLITSHDGEFILCADYELMLRLSFQPVRHRVLNRIGYTYLLHPGSFSYGNKFYLTTEKILEEHAEIASRYLVKEKQDVYSKNVIKRFRKMHLKSTAKLYLIKKFLDDEKGAALYSAKGLEFSKKTKWHRAVKKLSRKDSFKKLLEELKNAHRLKRSQVEKDDNAITNPKAV